MKYQTYREQKMHGTFDFPFEIYSVDKNHPFYYSTHHWHPETELIRVLSGEITVNVGTNSYNVQEGEMLFIGGGMLHIIEPKHNNDKYECLDFNLEFLSATSDLCKKYFNSQTMVQTHFTREDSEIINIAGYAFDAMIKKPKGYQLIVVGAVGIMLGKIVEYNKYTKTVAISSSMRKRLNAFEKVISYIDENYAHEISLEDLADVADMNPNYFCRFFKNMTGKTPVDYLNYFRVEKACIELVEGTQTIAEIADKCGYNDCGYFIKVFKRYKGVTPSKFTK